MGASGNEQNFRLSEVCKDTSHSASIARESGGSGSNDGGGVDGIVGGGAAMVAVVMVVVVIVVIKACNPSTYSRWLLIDGKQKVANGSLPSRLCGALLIEVLTPKQQHAKWISPWAVLQFCSVQIQPLRCTQVHTFQGW